MTLAYTISDANYFELTRGLVASIKSNGQNFSRIIIGDLGLKDSQRDELCRVDPRVAFIFFPRESGAKRLHDSEWVNRTSRKTEGLLSLIKQDLEVVMFDSDCLVLNDLSELCSNSKAIGVCRRVRPVVRREIRLDFIASFVYANGLAATPFVERWIEIQRFLIGRKKIQPPYETPAMCLAVNELLSASYFEVDESIYSCQSEFGANPKVIHLKSTSISDLDNLLAQRLGFLSDEDRSLISRYYV